MPLHPQSEHLLDWVHLTMRVTVLGQYLKGLSRLNQEGGAIVQKKLASVKWLLWHGKVDKALDRLGDFDRRLIAVLKWERPDSHNAQTTPECLAR